MTMNIKDPLVSKDDTDKLAHTFNKLHHSLVDDDDKAMLMDAFSQANSIINKYAETAVIASTENHLNKVKMTQMKLTMSGVSVAVKKFKEAAA